jgi:DNA-binding CsgD family transcriptional regulator
MRAESPSMQVEMSATSAEDWQLGLSARQREIMSLLTDGLSNKDIGHALGLTEGTVKQHLATIFRKLGVSNRTWAAALWRDRGGNSKSGKYDLRQELLRAGKEERGQSILVAPPRLIAAVALQLRREDLEASRRVVSEIYDEFLALSDHWVRVFDGQCELHIGGFLVATFGYPAAHADDVERAQHFAAAMLKDVQRHFDIRPACAVAAGIDRLIVRNGFVIDTDPLRRAVEGMQQSAESNLLPIVRSAKGDEVKLSGALAYRDAIHRAALAAPFTQNARQALSEGRSFWLAAEAWPPIHGKHFLDAFAQANPVEARNIVQLRLPSVAEADPQLLADQLRVQSAVHLPADADGKPVSWGLEYLAQIGPTMVVVHGSPDLDHVQRLLSPELKARLGELPLLFLVGALPLRGAPRLAVRPLGVFGERPMVGRVHEIVLPEDGFANAAGYPDICALIDQASDQERAILACLSGQTRATRQFIAKTTGSSLPETIRGLERLARLGLILAYPDGVAHLRDRATQKAVWTVCDVSPGAALKL